MNDIRAVLHSYQIDAHGNAASVDATTPPTQNSLIWIHLNAGHAEAKTFLKEKLHIDPLVIKSLTTFEARPRLDEFGDNMLLILRGIHFHPGPKPEDLVSVRIWIEPNRIVTLHHRKSRVMSDVAERIKKNPAPWRMGDFVSHIIDSLHDGIDPTIHELTENVDALEEKSIDDSTGALRQDIAQIRKQAIMFRRHLAPQREVIHRLQHSQQAWMSDSARWYMQDNYNRITRYLEDLDSTRERAQIVQDELDNAVASRLNKNIYRLSVITTIFMPLTFLTGLLGINVDGIPGAHHPKAFLVFCAILGLTIVAEIIYLRKQKWM